MLARHSLPAFRTIDSARPAMGEAQEIVRPHRSSSWRDAAASVRGGANRTGLGLLIALVIVLVPLLDALRFAGETLFHDPD